MDQESKEIQAFLRAIRDKFGYDFTDYAEASVHRRINHFMITRKIPNLNVLSDRILRSETEFEAFVQELSVTVTEMFRDPTFFKSLRENVIPSLATWPFIKIWIAGCATGEEVLSIAILLKENGLLNRSVIYATDINQNSLRIAKSGIYSIDSMQKHTSNYLKSGGTKDFSDYYTAKYQSVMFNKELLQNVVISPHNLATDQSFNEFQLIVCRNVLIYFNQQLQNKVVKLFTQSLSPFGFLALGNKESLLFSEDRKGYEEFDRKEKIFRKRGT
jgi:chemotaxis protein methyltransferase CheR